MAKEEKENKCKQEQLTMMTDRNLKPPNQLIVAIMSLGGWSMMEENMVQRSKMKDKLKEAMIMPIVVVKKISK